MTDEGLLKPGERIDCLIDERLKIIQNPQTFRFSADAVLLARFVTVKPGDIVCDLGTGTGVIPLLLSQRTRAAKLYGLEIQAGMADMARRSVIINGLTDRISIDTGDLREAVARYGSSRFDAVVSNPPYYAACFGRLNASDALTLARHEVACTLEDVVKAAARITKSRGRAAFIHKPHRLVDLIVLLRANRLEPKRLQVVYARPGRKPAFVLVEAVKDGGAELAILNPLYIYDADGEYTLELRDIYFGERE
ncbi:MAG: tRNA1(Val) (adenine(37)-N6)-methyltransferase [bacterium]|jgi:tRNA1Val (adenine37-N6)-methyltransferase